MAGKNCGAPGLVDRVFSLDAGSRGFDSHRRHMSERFYRSNRPGYPHPVCSELENSGIRVAVGDCSITERRGGVRLFKPANLYMCTQTHYKHDEHGRMAPGVRGHGSVPLSHSGNVDTIIGLQTMAGQNAIFLKKNENSELLLKSCRTSLFSLPEKV